jgi:5'-deoxynucleotidase
MSKSNHFFALLHRMKYIFRWGLMRSSRPENVCEHTCDVAMLAHALAVIGRDVFGKDVDPAAIATAALFHDASEIITGDLPTPVKYINKQLSGAYKAVEQTAKERLLQTLPEELVESYRPLLFLEEENPTLYRYVKAADKLSAYLKCLEERKSGNAEFARAETELSDVVDRLSAELPEVAYFKERLMPGFFLTLDELNEEEK